MPAAEPTPTRSAHSLWRRFPYFVDHFFSFFFLFCLPKRGSTEHPCVCVCIAKTAVCRPFRLHRQFLRPCPFFSPPFSSEIDSHSLVQFADGNDNCKMLSADPPHAFAMRALPSAMGNLVAYLFGWGRRQGLLRRDDEDEDDNDDVDDAHQSNGDQTNNDDDRNRDGGALGGRTRARSRDAAGRTAFYRILTRGPMVDAERMIESTLTPRDFMALVGDPLALSTAVAGDRVAAILLVGRHAARLGIDPHALFGDVYLCDTRAGGHTATGALGSQRGSLVHLACATDSAAVLALLLRMGVDPQHRCASTRSEAARADTPLHVAARAGARACVAVLLGAGASPNAEARDAMTPLHEAAGNGHTDVARLLLAWGASTTTRRRHDGATAAGVATHAGYPATAAAISIVGDVRHCARDTD